MSARTNQPTSNTNSADVPSAPPETHQRAGGKARDDQAQELAHQNSNNVTTMQTKDLTGTALDWAVGQCEQIELAWFPESTSLFFGRGFAKWRPSTDWSQGGPIIERERIETRYDRTGRFSEPWIASTLERMITGPTPLIAAMRCLVTSKLGATVDVPTELLP